MYELARRVKPLDLGIGFPNFAPSKVLLKDLQEVVDGENFTIHQYTRGFVSYAVRGAVCGAVCGA